MKFIKLFLTFLISIAAVSGDYLVFKSSFAESRIFRAVSDTTVHAIIGFLSAVIFFNFDISVKNTEWIFNIALCTLISFLIDIDHVFVARSFHIKDITNTKQRGILHCTTFWIAISASLLTYSYLAGKQNMYLSTYMIILAYTSHHIRDGNRRGLWMYPFDHTPPIHKYLYVTLVAILPVVFAYIYNATKPIKQIVSYTMFV